MHKELPESIKLKLAEQVARFCLENSVHIEAAIEFVKDIITTISEAQDLESN